MKMANLLKAGAGLTGAALVVTVALGFVPWDASQGEPNPAAAAMQVQPSATPSESPEPTEECLPEFTQEELERATGQVDPRYEAKTRPLFEQHRTGQISGAELTEQLNETEIQLMGTNAQVLAARAHEYDLFDNPNNWQPLVEGGVIEDGGCLSEAGMDLVHDVEIAMSFSTVTSGEADAAGTNTGINGATFGIDEHSGIRGDRAAFIRTFNNGMVSTVLVRCMNIVYMNPPDVPKVPTDNPPPPPPPQPPQPPVLEPKIPSLDPAPRGNAPIGGGQNQDPGPGPYVPPEEMEQPPATPYVPPAPPAPAPPAPAPAPAPSDPGTPPPPPVPTPDPAPAPPPEQSAPPPADPVDPGEGSGCAPGMTC